MNVSWCYRALALAGGLAAGCESVNAQDLLGSFERTFELDEPIELVVTADSGSVTVRDGEDDQARVRGRIVNRRRGQCADEDIEKLVRELETDPPLELVGGTLRVGRDGTFDFDRWFHRCVSISYEIDTPAQTTVRSNTGSGSQTISGIRGRVEASAGSGSMALIDLAGGTEARTGSGSIRANGIAGDFRAQAGSGSVELAQSGPGDVEISTGSGSSKVSGIDGALRLRAGSGSITVAGNPARPWDLNTGSGFIRARLPKDAAFELDAEARSGDIYTDHPVTLQGSVSRRHLSGQVRGGGPLVRVRSGSGSIRIE